MIFYSESALASLDHDLHASTMPHVTD